MFYSSHTYSSYTQYQSYHTGTLEVFQIKQQGITCKGDPVMRHNCCYYPVFILDVLHTPADGVKSQHEGLSSPKP